MNFLRFLCTSIFIAGTLLAKPHPYTGNFGLRPLTLGAYHAILGKNDALHYNPASIFVPSKFLTNINYLYHTDQKHHWAGVSLVDSETSFLAAGIDYHLGISLSEQKEFSLFHVGTLALALPIIEQFLSLGGSVKYIRSPISSKESNNLFQADLGLLGILPFGLSLGATGHNLLPIENDVAPLSLGVGAALQTQMLQGDSSTHETGLTISGDYVFTRDVAKNTYHQILLGAEYVVAEVLPVRLGYVWSKEEDNHLLKAGIGFLTQYVSIELLYQQDIYNSNLYKLSLGTEITF